MPGKKNALLELSSLRIFCISEDIFARIIPKPTVGQKKGGLRAHRIRVNIPVIPNHRASSMSAQAVLQSIRDREFAYLLSSTRLKVKQKTPRIDIGSIHLDPMNEGDAVDLPRWIAEVLIGFEICESQEESFASEVFKAVTREKIAGADQLSTLRPDFYLKIRRHLAFASTSN
ncbi:MAG: hypothetical protein ACREBS_07825, partial [Nitrososphaerales archaeon]